MGNKSRGNMKEAMKNQKRSLLRCAMPCYVAFHIDRFSIFRRQLEGVNGLRRFLGPVVQENQSTDLDHISRPLGSHYHTSRVIFA